MDISKLVAQLKAEITDTAFPRMPVGKMALKTTCTTKDEKSQKDIENFFEK